MTGFPSPDDLVRSCFSGALTASNPALPLTRALDQVAWDDNPTYLLACGKAAIAMSDAAQRWADSRGRRFSGGLIVAPDSPASPARDLHFHLHLGDHPVPGDNSFAAAEAVEQFVADLPGDATVHVMLSGGASALWGAPIPGVSRQAYQSLFEVLLSSGLSIDEMNAVRKRVAQWGAGRLALALTPRRTACWLLSDVPGDDPATIASGPCSPDQWTSQDIAALLARGGLDSRLDSALRQALMVETLKANDQAFANQVTCIVANNATALAGACAEAARQRCPQRRLETPLTGEARLAGRAIAIESMRLAAEWEAQSSQLADEGRLAEVRPLLLYQGGETTVTHGDGSGRGGRSQEVALAAAELLEVSPFPVTFLAGGTDGIDGPTDAAGAMVSSSTWSIIASAGIDPHAALRRHDSYTALAAADALIKTGATGTNVMDVVLVVVGSARAPE